MWSGFELRIRDIKLTPEIMSKKLLKILCAATCFKYTEQNIPANIDFVMTDSTLNNLEVRECLQRVWY